MKRLFTALLALALASCTTSDDAHGGGSAAQGGASSAMLTGGAGGMQSAGGAGGMQAVDPLSGGSGGNAGTTAGVSGNQGAAGSGGMSGASGAGTDAMVDASTGGTSALHDAGPRGCADADYILCEDFDDAPLGGTPDGWTKHGDASAVADDFAHSGHQSLKLDAIPVWERRIYHDASGIGSAHWGRIYFKVKQPVPDAFVHSTLVAFSGVGPTRGASEFRVVDTVKQAKNQPDIGSRIQFLYNVQPQSSGEFGEGTSYDREFEDAWHCAEWHIDASDQSYAFYLDGEELMSFAKGAGNFEGSDIPTSFGEIKIGWINYQDAPPGFTAWLDDLAVDDSSIGCE